MSEDEYEYEYEDYGDFYSDDEGEPDIVQQVDSLAEHTCHSPILVNALPDYSDNFIDYVYLSDEQWNDEENVDKEAGPSKDPLDKKRKRGNEEDKSEGRKKRQKVKIVPDVKSQPSVIWRSNAATEETPVPVIKDGDGEEVILLENWREILEGQDPILSSTTTKKLGVKTKDKPAAGKEPANTRKSKRRHEEVEKVNPKEPRVSVVPKRTSKRIRQS